MNQRNRSRILVLALALTLLAGCASQQAFRRAEQDMRRQDYDRAVLAYSKALALDPGNTRFAVALERAKLKAAAEHFQKGKRYYDAGQLDLAITEFQQTLILQQGNQHAATELQRASRELQRQRSAPSELEALKERARQRNLGPPKLDPRSNIPILLNFQEREVGKIFDAISKASGINFIYDEKVELDRPRTIDIGNVTLEKALDILMLQTKNFYKVIDEYTLLIAPDTRQKRQEYEDQVIRTFFLSNADTKTVVTLLRSLLQSRQIAENADLNSVTIKDTPEKVAIGERILNANDKAKGEVLIDVELLEINRTTAQNLGLDLSSKALSLSFRDGMQSVPLNNLNSINQTGAWSLGVIPSVVLNFLRSDSDTKTIAKPQLRVSEGERAEILIGDRVPIPTTSFNTSQTIGGNIVPITSFTYQNVGITVQMEPRVHHNKEVTLQVQVEISQIGGVIETAGGQGQPIIGTRQIQTVIRLRDGETNMLAGLIQRTDTESRSGIPGLQSIPGLRRVFGNNNRSSIETDIIMTLTPHIIRIPDITEEDLETLWVGTEENMQLRGAARSAMAQGPFGAPVGVDLSQPVTLDVPPAGDSGRATAGANRISPSQPDARDSTPSTPPRRTPPGSPADTPNGGAASQPPRGPFPPAGDPAADPADDPDAGPDDQAPSGPAVVRLVPSAPSYRVGETVVLNVTIENARNVGSVPFHLKYNPDVLQFIGPATEGPFMQSDGSNTVFLAGPLGDGGEVVVGLSRMGGSTGSEGSGVLASFQFQALAPGSANFGFTGASVKDPQARNLPAAFNTATVVIQP